MLVDSSANLFVDFSLTHVLRFAVEKRELLGSTQALLYGPHRCKQTGRFRDKRFSVRIVNEDGAGAKKPDELQNELIFLPPNVRRRLERKTDSVFIVFGFAFSLQPCFFNDDHRFRHFQQLSVNRHQVFALVSQSPCLFSKPPSVPALLKSL